MASKSSNLYYTYTFTIQRTNRGNDITFSFSSDSDTKAKLKAKIMVKQMKGYMLVYFAYKGFVKPKFEKTLAPYKQKHETTQKILEKMLE